MDETPLFLTVPDILRLRRASRDGKGREVRISLDVGRSQVRVSLLPPNHFRYGEQILPIPASPDSERTILIWREKEWEAWQRFDRSTNKYYKMVFVAEGVPPTVEISGIKMHVTQGGSPLEDTRRKLKTLGRLRGRVLDTCLGLGYTAIAEARYEEVQQVLVCEADPNLLAFCAENPWSQEVLNHPKIQLIVAPVETVVTQIPPAYFRYIVHDPPRFSLAPQLYQLQFYRELFRVLKTGGALYHYTGNPHQRQRKRSLATQTAERLYEAGFARVKIGYQGVVARKE